MEESLLTLDHQNELCKREIQCCLDELFQRQDIERFIPFDTSITSRNIYSAELSKYKQKMNQELTRIGCELRKFLALNPSPIFKGTIRSNESIDEDPDDIETLKKNCSLLISKLNRNFLSGEENASEASVLPSKSDADINSSQEIKYPFVSKNVFENLSDHTKDMLKEISTDSTDPGKKSEMFFVDVSCTEHAEIIGCEHFPEIKKHFPEISRSCSLHNTANASEVTFDNNNNCGHFPVIEARWPEIIKICPKRLSSESESSSSTVVETEKIISSCELNLDNVESDLFLDNPPQQSTSSVQYAIDKMNLLIDIEDDTNIEIKKESIDQNEEDGEVISSTFKFVENLAEINEQITKNFMELTRTSNVDQPLNNEMRSTKAEDSSSITESDTDKLCENDHGYSVDTDLEKNSPQRKKKKHRNHRGVLEKTGGAGENQNLKDTPRIQNNLGEDTIKDRNDLLVVNETESPSNQQTLKDCNLTVNAVKPVYSAEEKIRKLGLEDRWTRFENTRQVAVLPDVRLQPSVSDAEKMKQIEKQGNKFEIADRTIPNLYTTCVFSHIESPLEFYIHLDDEESKLIDPLNEVITQHFKRSKTPYRSKFEAFESIGKFCCAYVKDDKIYYRAEVINWFFEKETKVVLVQLVDYGNLTFVHYKHLRQLTTQFSSIPKIAVKCYLPMLYPPGSTKSNIFTDWPMSSIEAFRELSGLCQADTKIFWKIFYIHKIGDRTGVDMHEVKDVECNTIGQLLIDIGHAVQIILPEDDPDGLAADDEDIRKLEECNNINEVVLGYDPKDEARICKFTRQDGTCFKGKNCRQEHRKFAVGGYTTDQTFAFASAFNEIALPGEAECTRIKFTGFLGASHYYVNLVKFADLLRSLELLMNDPKNISTYEGFKIMPAYGEIVVVKHWTKRWLRARVRHHSYDDEGYCTGVQVFMVDYGDTIDCSMQNVKQIRAEFLELPFQAVECILYNFKAKNDVNEKEMDKFFYENMINRVFDVQVIVSYNNILAVSITHKDRNLGDILAERGFVVQVNRNLPASNSLVIPG